MSLRILLCATSLLALLATGCLVDPDEQIDPASESIAADDPAEVADDPAEVAADVAADVAAAELGAVQTCFTCDLDPSVHSCSSIASRAFHICQRACLVCDDFGDQQGVCFFGLCSPD
jgi:hypothetical protein